MTEEPHILPSSWPKVPDIEGSNEHASGVLTELNEVTGKVWETAALDLNGIEYLNQQIIELDSKLHKYDSHLGRVPVQEDDNDDFINMNDGADEDAQAQVVTAPPETFSILQAEHQDGLQDLSFSLRRTLSSSRVLNERRCVNYYETVTVEDSKKKRNLKMVEFAVYPGFSEKELSPLPGVIEPLQVLSTTVNALSIPPGQLSEFESWFYSEAALAILTDFFWWVFLSVVQRVKDVQNTSRLFTRIADSFVLLFSMVPKKSKDMFFKYFPNGLSQAIYSAFCEAYPQSRKRFTTDFCYEVAQTVYEWTTGTKPSAAVVNNWRLDLLAPKVNRALILEELDKKPDESKDPVILEYEKRQKQRQQKKLMLGGQRRTKSTPIGPSQTCVRFLFDIKGNSPLISHYLSGHKIARDTGTSVLVRRTEKLHTKAYFRQLTYADVISSAITHGRANRSQMNKTREESKKLKQQMIQDHTEKEKEMLREQRIVLQKPREVKLLSNELAERNTKPVPIPGLIVDVKANDYIGPHEKAEKYNPKKFQRRNKDPNLAKEDLDRPMTPTTVARTRRQSRAILNTYLIPDDEETWTSENGVLVAGGAKKGAPPKEQGGLLTMPEMAESD